MTQPSQQAGPKDRPAALMSPMSQLTCDTLTQSATVPNHSGSVTILAFKCEHLIPVHLFEHRFRGWIGRDLRPLPTSTQTRGDRRPSARPPPPWMTLQRRRRRHPCLRRRHQLRRALLARVVSRAADGPGLFRPGRPANKPRTPLTVAQFANSRTSFPCPDRFFSSLSARIRLVLGVKKFLDWLGQKYFKELIDLSLLNSQLLNSLALLCLRQSLSLNLFSSQASNRNLHFQFSELDSLLFIECLMKILNQSRPRAQRQLALLLIDRFKIKANR